LDVASVEFHWLSSYTRTGSFAVRGAVEIATASSRRVTTATISLV
jgi:hypothetical protein